MKKTKKRKLRDKIVTVNGKAVAYVAVIDEKGDVRMGVATEGERGYTPVREDSDLGGTYSDYKVATLVADEMNERLGVSREDALKIVASSMFRRST